MSFLPGAAISSGGYNINNSLRFRQSASASLTRTPSSAGNRRTWTWSGWVKRGALVNTSNPGFFAGYVDSSNRTELKFTTADLIEFLILNTTTVGQLVTTQVFRDPSAWYHIVVQIDTTQATAANRMRLYVNGSQVTSFSSTTTPAQNTLTQVNNTSTQALGRNQSATTEFFDGYLAEVYLIDGQSLDASSFGETDTTTGVWKPKAYTGTYGTNGFYQNYSSIALTSGSNTGLGQDFSGNGNFYNTTNISVTAGVTYDAMTDVPTLTSATTANYPVFNAVDGFATAPTFNNGNLEFVGPAAVAWARASMAFPNTGKWYLEARNPNATTTTLIVGLVLNTLNPTTTGNIAGNAATYGYNVDGNKIVAGVSSAYGATWPLATDVIGIAFDADAGTLTMYKNNVSQGTLATGLTGTYYFVAIDNNATNARTVAVNFGQQPFAYTPPTGFNRLNTFNLPTSTIVKGNSFMDATTYTGTGASRSVTNAAGFRPDLVWMKARNSAEDHALYDSVRGATNQLIPSSNIAATTEAQGLTAFNSNGFTVGSSNLVNLNGASFVGWQWQAGSSTVTNTSGTISAQVRANTTTGFSIVTYTGNSSTSQTVGHGLGVAPKMLIVKGRNSAGDNWAVWHTAFTATQVIYLELANGVGTDIPDPWTAIPTSTVFSVNSTNHNTNESGVSYVAYLWAEIAGFSAFGSYTGNGNANGPFVYTGFRPKFVLFKNASTGATNWVMLDSSRNLFNVTNLVLVANVDSTENTATSTGAIADFLSNGFKIRGTGSFVNTNGNTIIYAAFAENPFKNALAR